MKESEIRPQNLLNRYLELSRRDIKTFFSDKSRFVDVPCPGCTSQERELGMDILGFDYMTCFDCNSLYLSPRPTDEMILAYYRLGESVKFWGTTYFRETAEARRQKVFKPRAQLVSEWADRLDIDGSGGFVDVGPGYGIFLEEVSRLDRFSKVFGIEPSPNLAAICRERGFDIVDKVVEAVEPGEIQASFASTFDVLGTLSNPLEFLKGVRRCLRPGGVFLLTTLTVTGFDMQVLWDQSKVIFPPNYINLLSVDGTEQLVRRAGFDIVDVATPGQLDLDIIRNVVKENPNIHLPRFVKQLVFHSSDETREAFQQFLQQQLLSSHLRIIAQVP